MNTLRSSKTIKSILWSAVERFSVQGAQFVLGMIIARLVAPSEYGLIAMISIFLAVAQTFIDSGFSSALIQKKNRTEDDFSTVFYFNIVISLFIYLLLFILAPSIANFYNEQLLEVILKWIGLNIVISAFSIVQRARLTIQLNFKIQAKASFIAVIMSGIVGIALAYNNYGVWALVTQSLLNTLLSSCLLCIFAHWVPRWVFSYKSFKTLFSFGSKLLLSGLLNTVYLNLYTLIIGKQYSASDVGYYNRSYSIAQYPSTNIGNIMMRVIYPTLCEIQDDRDKLSQIFINYIRMFCYVIFPLMICLAVIAKPLILVILTDKWIAMADLLSILCVAYMWLPVMLVNCQMLNIRGRSDYYLKSEIIKKVLGVGILIITIPFGLKTLCIGILIYNILDMIVVIYYVKKVIYTSYKQQIKAIFPSLFLSIGVGTIVSLFLLVTSNIYVQLIGGIIIGGISFILMSSLLKIKEYKDLLFSFGIKN